jgi:hypothetical protein
MTIPEPTPEDLALDPVQWMTDAAEEFERVGYSECSVAEPWIRRAVAAEKERDELRAKLRNGSVIYADEPQPGEWRAN